MTGKYYGGINLLDMETIKFLPEFIPQIKSGEKADTFRPKKGPSKYKVGQKYLIEGTTVVIEITHLMTMPLANAGWKSIENWQKCYKNTEWDFKTLPWCYRYTFKVVDNRYVCLGTTTGRICSTKKEGSKFGK